MVRQPKCHHGSKRCSLIGCQSLLIFRAFRGLNWNFVNRLLLINQPENKPKKENPEQQHDKKFDKIKFRVDNLTFKIAA